MSLRSVILPLLLATSSLPIAAPAHAQAPGDRQQQDIRQGEDCLRQMESDPAGSLTLARNMLARENASDTIRVMALACLMRGQLMAGDGNAAATSLQALVPLLESARLPRQLRIEMQLLTATALQELGQLRQAGAVLEAALAESGPYTNLHIQALVAIALHHARGMGDPAGAEPYFERAIAAIAKRPGGPIPTDAIPYFNYGFAALEQGRADDAAALLEQAHDLARRDKHLDRLRARIEGALGRTALERGDLALARRQLEDAVGLQRSLDDAPGLASSLRQLGELALLEGEPARALEYGRESAELTERGRMVEQVPESFELMARIQSALGNAAEARAWSDRARRHLAELNRERVPAIAAALEAQAPRPDAWIDQLGSLTQARVVGIMALLALAATLLIGGRVLLRVRRQQQQRGQSSTTDPLTGLANRRDATRQLDALPAIAGDGDLRTALLLLDIDHFKAINDAHGHEAGDRILVALADCLRQACDANDFLVRWGGEEFLVLRPQTSQAAARALAEHLRAAVEALAVQLPGGESASVTVSLGLAPYPYFPGNEGWQDAIRMADRALYAAKHSGRNAWAGTWGEAAGAHVDVYSVRQDPEGALAQGWITVFGSRPITWSTGRDMHSPRLPASGHTDPGRHADHLT